MFEDFVKNISMEDEIKPSKKRIKTNLSALRSLIEQEENMNTKRKPSRISKKPFALATTIAACICLTSITAFAASKGVFTSIKKAFYNDDNALRASEPSDYAFLPDTDPITGDGVTINVTEAIATDHDMLVFMDIIFENGLPKEMTDNPNFNYDGICFDDHEINIESGSISEKTISVEDNIVSHYIIISEVQENEWKTNGFELGIKNLGCFTAAAQFIKFSDISGKISIPAEQIKINNSVTARSDIDGVSAEMELSLMGISITFDSEEDFDKIKEKIANQELCYIITRDEINIHMKDGTVYGNGENMDKSMVMEDNASAGPNSDGTYSSYITFSIPVDIENIEKITLGGYEFKF